MVFRFQIHNLALFLSLCASSHPTRFRQRCGGFLPMVLSPIGFLRFRLRFETVRFLSRHLYEFVFFQSKKRFQTWPWDPGDSDYKTDYGGIRLWNSHIHGSSLVFVSETGILGLPRLKTLIFLYIGDVILSNLLFISFDTREMLLQFNIRDLNFHFADVISDQFVVSVHDQIGFPGTAMSRLLVALVIYWRQDMIDIAHICWLRKALAMHRWKYWRQGGVGIAQIGRLENASAMSRWVLIDMRGSSVWDDLVNLSVVMLKRITQSKYFKETLVRKCWCHYVSISGLALDTSASMLRFVIRSHSHKLLFTIRNKERSNMKLDNNRSFDWLASKATLRKASSNSLLLYFLLVYGTYI